MDHRPHDPPLEVDAQKKTLRAAEQDEGARLAFAHDVLFNLDPADLVSVDEASANLAMTRLYARAPQGERAIGAAPRNYPAPTTLITALSPKGVQAAMSLEGAVDNLAFRHFARDVLGPTLRKGQVVAVDNLSVHQDPEVRAIIEEYECALIHLPTYSPDLAPAEPAIAKIKAYLRKVGARTQEALDEALAQAVALVTPEDARGFFSHAGYLLPAVSS